MIIPYHKLNNKNIIHGLLHLRTSDVIMTRDRGELQSIEKRGEENENKRN